MEYFKGKHWPPAQERALALEQVLHYAIQLTDALTQP